jgi:hypothetical protein
MMRNAETNEKPASVFMRVNQFRVFPDNQGRFSFPCGQSQPLRRLIVDCHKTESETSRN